MAEGQTATNPQTGERVVLRGGQWVPMGGSASPIRSSQPRGVRNNNPGNVEDGAFARSLPGYAGSDGRFARFDTPEAGEQVAPRLLASYISRGFNTPNSIINRWAPPSDNNPTQQYAQYVAQRVGVGPDDRVTEEHIPLIAAAIKEFENGQTVRGGAQPQFAAPTEQAAAPTGRQIATNAQTGEQVELIDGAWVPVGTVDPRSGAITVEEIDPAREARMQDPEYQRAFEAAQRGSANVPEALRAFGQGQTLGFLDEINAQAQGGIQGLDNLIRQATGQEIEYGMEAAAQAARDSERDAQAAYARENPVQNFGLGLAGGLLTPGLNVGGNYIAGAQGAARLGRAGQVGAAYGAGAGFGNAEGDILERAPEAALGAAIGYGTGAVGQRVADRLAPSLTPKAPSAARILSREGVDLTPGQMAAELPIIGNTIRSLEEGASAIPFVGGPIAGARQQSVETFNRAAVNRVLDPIGEKLPSRVRAGYDAVDDAQRRVSQAYDRALSGVELVPDEQLYDGLGRAINSAVENAGVTGGRRVASQITERVFRVLGDYADTPMNGQQFKALESEFTNLAGNALESTDGATRAVGRAYQGVNDALRRALREQNPGAADALKNANNSYARLMRIERAAASSASQANDGVFSPTQLGQAVAQAGGRRANARGDALLQDLAVAGRSIIPSRVGDSGTATRGAVTGLVAGAASGVPLAGTVAVPVIATSLAYSRPAQAALNALYRASDSQSANANLQQLARLVQRNPALQPYYQDAAEYVLSLSQTQSPTNPPAPQQPQPPSPALQRVLQP